MTLQAFEEAPAVFVNSVVPGDLRDSVRHRVEEVSVDNGTYRFYIDSDFGPFEVVSLVMLRERVREIQILGNAMTQLNREVDETERPVQGQFEIRSDRALDILSRPVESAANLAGQVAGNISETFSGAVAAQERAEIYGGAETDDPVMALHRRNIASQWQLDVYSTNRRVQDFLATVARSRSGGRISAGTPALNRVSVGPLNVSDEDLEFELRGLLKSKSVVDLREGDEAFLAGLGIAREPRLSFINNPVLSPSHKTRISHYLGTLREVGNLQGLLDTAAEVHDDPGAAGFELLVMMLAHYHRHTAPLARLLVDDGQVYAATAAGSLLQFSVQDLVYWNAGTEELFDRAAALAAREGFPARGLVCAGTVTDTAGAELAARGFTVQAGYVSY